MTHAPKHAGQEQDGACALCGRTRPGSQLQASYGPSHQPRIICRDQASCQRAIARQQLHDPVHIRTTNPRELAWAAAQGAISQIGSPQGELAAAIRVQAGVVFALLDIADAIRGYGFSQP